MSGIVAVEPSIIGIFSAVNLNPSETGGVLVGGVFADGVFAGGVLVGGVLVGGALSDTAFSGGALTNVSSGISGAGPVCLQAVRISNAAIIITRYFFILIVPLIVILVGIEARPYKRRVKDAAPYKDLCIFPMYVRNHLVLVRDKRYDRRSYYVVFVGVYQPGPLAVCHHKKAVNRYDFPVRIAEDRVAVQIVEQQHVIHTGI